MSASRSLPALALLATCLTTQPAQAQWPTLTVTGQQPSDTLGLFVAGVGDVNGDGVEDLAGYTMSETRVYSGKDGAELHAFRDYGVISGAGDVNGNGFPDIIIGEESWSQGRGRAVVYDGSTGLLILAVSGSTSNDGLGCAVDGVGDLNQDGFDDFVVGARGAGANAEGAAIVYAGPYGAVIRQHVGTVPTAGMGHSVAGVGDVDGDGVPDYATGAPWYDNLILRRTDAGRASVWNGATGLLQYSRIGASGDKLGTSVAGLGDVDGDALADVAAGAIGDDDFATDCGSVHVYSGPSGTWLHTRSGSTQGELFGLTLTGPGDLDGDGLADVAAGSHHAATGYGEVVTFRGLDGTLFDYYYGSPQSILGYSIGSMDVNGDGLGDLLLGEPVDSSFQGKITVMQSCPARWSNYGSGWPGTGGVPSLTALGDPVLGANLSVQIGNSSAAPTYSLLYLGLGQNSIATNFDGTLLVDFFMILGLNTPGSGLTLSGQIPNDPGALCGVSINLQVHQLDPGATRGWSFSRGLELWPGFAYP